MGSGVPCSQRRIRRGSDDNRRSGGDGLSSILLATADTIPATLARLFRLSHAQSNGGAGMAGRVESRSLTLRRFRMAVDSNLLN